MINAMSTTNILDFLAIAMSVIHVYIFYLESIAWGKPSVNRAFGVTDAHAQIMRPMAFNQGFYNLFLAIAFLVAYFWASHAETAAAAQTLRDYAALSVLGAGFILWLSNPKLIRPALIQAGPAALYWIMRLAFQ